VLKGRKIPGEALSRKGESKETGPRTLKEGRTAGEDRLTDPKSAGTGRRRKTVKRRAAGDGRKRTTGAANQIARYFFATLTL
jgi:hypothetical protein